MLSLKSTLLALAALAGLASCQDVIDLDLPAGQPVLAVDGYLTDRGQPAVVQLSLTQGYYNDAANPAVRGATLVLQDDLGHQDVLRETATPGRYIGTGAVPGQIGRRYTLTIDANGQRYRAETEMKRTPGIDSVVVEFKPKQLGYDEGYYALYNGPELPGVGDYYRFKVYKNGTLFNKPGDLIVRSDELVDGRYIGHVELNAEPLTHGDRLRVELCAIPRDYFYFLNELFGQINNAGLFATSPANVRTNVKNLSGDPKHAAVGYFAAYPVRTDSVTVK